MTLNPSQLEAVHYMDGPLMIIAGAGSGKTRVISHRIAFLAREVGIPLWQVMAVTFTNKAAKEMRSRVCSLLGMADDRSLAISTFHARGASILRREAAAAGIDRDFAILDDKDQLTAVKQAMEQAGITDKRVRPSQVAEFINLAKMKLLTPAECTEEFDEGEVPYAALYKAYEAILHKSSSLDFEDLLFRVVRLFQADDAARRRWAEKYRYVLVDEYQDTNHGQFLLTRMLAQDHRQVTVVGDEDQSIYSWRGADITNLLDFQKSFPGAKIVKLEQNYRSTRRILRAASTVIAKNTQRIGKTLFTEGGEGEPIAGIIGQDENDEADQVARRIAALLHSGSAKPEDIAVFYRAHRLARAIEDAMNRMRIPYRIVGAVRFYDRAEIKDVLSFARLAIQPGNNLAFERVANVPARGVGPKALGDIVARALSRDVSYFEAAKSMLADGEFKGKARAGMEEFLAAVARWNGIVASERADSLLSLILADTKFKTIGVGDPQSLDGRARIENIEEFETVAREFVEAEPSHTLGAFLEAMALDAQREEDTQTPKVSLMTVHNAKGLEYDNVFIVALDEGVFPNSRTKDNPDQFEEERRLFYVAVTRARKRLWMSRARRRMLAQYWEDTEPSTFLLELPEDVLEEGFATRLGLYRRQSSYGSYTPSPSYGGSSRPSLYGANRPAAPAAGYRTGEWVVHQQMGRGRVAALSGRPGNERVTVDFEDGRRQEFVLRWAPLRRA